MKQLYLLAMAMAVIFTACKKNGLPVNTHKADSTVALSNCTEAPTLAWFEQIAGSSRNLALTIGINSSGLVAAVGVFRGQVDFDPGPGSFYLTAAADIDSPGYHLLRESSYHQQLDTAGKFVDASESGTVYATKEVTSAIGLSYVMHLDTITKRSAAGAVLTEIKAAIATNLEEHFISIATDASGKLYSSGVIIKNRVYGKYGIVLDPGTSTYYVKAFNADGTQAWNTLTSKPLNYLSLDAAGNIYGLSQTGETILKLNGAGNIQSTIAVSPSFSPVIGQPGNVLAVDKQGNMYISGNFKNTFDFDPGAGVSNLTSGVNDDAFLKKIDASGKFVWAIQLKNLGKYQYDSAITIVDIAVDDADNIYLTGNFFGQVNINPGTGSTILTKPYAEYFSQAATDAYVLKLKQCHQ